MLEDVLTGAPHFVDTVDKMQGQECEVVICSSPVFHRQVRHVPRKDAVGGVQAVTAA